MTPNYEHPDAWKYPEAKPLASIRTFRGPRGRWTTGIWVRGGTEEQLAEFVATDNHFKPVRRAG